MLPILLLAAAAAAPQTPIDAERAFASDAKTIGQWTAFRKWSTDDSVMFVPQAINTHEFLKDRKDPPKVIDWWPTASYISCDGSVAVNTGGWKRPDGTDGYFSTVWVRQPDGGWKWTVDGGDGLKAARNRPAKPLVSRASCRKPGPNGNQPADPANKSARGESADHSLTWSWSVAPDGARTFTTRIWDGKAFVPVIDDKITA
ncbi:MAG: hypothetical protein ABIQ43_01500 [Sphingomonas sp.]